MSNRGTLDTIVQPSGVTDPDGRATVTLRSTTAGTVTISAIVMDDGVVLSQPASVTFQQYTPPDGALVFQIDRLVDTANDSLDQIASDAGAIAGGGRYFRGAIGADSARLATGVVFNMADVVGGTNQTWQLQKAARLACPGCYVPGTWNVQMGRDHPAAARLLDIGFTRLEDAPAAKIAEFVGWGGPQFYGKALNQGARYVTKEAAKSATQTIFVNAEDGMSSIAHPAVAETAGALSSRLESNRDSLLANWPAMALSEQSAYADDLIWRSKALIILGQQLDDERMTLANFRQSQQESTQSTLANFLLRFAAKGLAGGFFDGPGLVAVGSFYTAFDGYMDSKRLSEAVQMYGVATGALLGAPDALRQIYQTADKGIERIMLGLPPDCARGQITGVIHRNQGSGWGPFWSETASWSEVSLANTGNSETTYRVLAGYLADTTRFGVPWATMSLVEEAAITLAPGTSGTARLEYKRANGTKGFSPRSEYCLPLAGCVPASMIYIYVLGTNDAGTYYIDNHQSDWGPARLTLSGAPDLAQADELATIDPLLTTYVLSAPWTQRYEAQIWINNPFTSTVPVTVSQALTPGINLLDVGGATRTGDSLTWNKVVSPSALSVVTFTFGFSATPGAENALPPANLDLTGPLDGQPLTTTSNVAGFRALWPLTLDYVTPGYVLPGSSSNVVVTVTNWLADSAIAGTLAISVTDALSPTVHTESKPFGVSSNATGAISFTVPGMATGQFIVRGAVSVEGTSAEAFADPLQVGLPGPFLDFQVSPVGAVGPGELLTYTLRFTNTSGVPLTGAVLTASLPLSVTVIPGSVTGGGSVEAGEVRWTLGAVGTGQTVARAFAVQVDADAPSSQRLLSQPHLSANEIAPTPGPLAWNMVKQEHELFLPVVLRNY